MMVVVKEDVVEVNKVRSERDDGYPNTNSYFFQLQVSWGEWLLPSLRFSFKFSLDCVTVLTVNVLPFHQPPSVFNVTHNNNWLFPRQELELQSPAG